MPAESWTNGVGHALPSTTRDGAVSNGRLPPTTDQTPAAGGAGQAEP
ncbi:hypothetical protein [Herbidospora sp. NBRC 101105]|nr:hypothetical protein [Herbidospora sp. NBRC 101105]